MQSEGGSQRSLARPRAAALAPELRAAAVGIAERLARQGTRAWIVGGAVRDLALGRAPDEVDMASAATPERVERIFPGTLAVGRAFGTLIVPWPDAGAADRLDIQLTTFRSESGYADGRRPDRVSFGASPEEDARRRDFTANALYLDPLDDTLLDPTGGLVDLARGRLACVGEAGERFREDGLRLLRMARLCAALELEPDQATLAAARASVAALSGVSAERVGEELEKALAREHAARALELYERAGLVEPLFGAWLAPRDFARAREQIARLPDPPGPLRALALLCAELDPERVRAALNGLRSSRERTQQVLELVSLVARLEEAARAGAPRSERLRIERARAFADALALARARHAHDAQLGAALAELERERSAARAEDLFPEAWITSADVARAGVGPGPAFGALLAEAETLQLDRAFADRAAALAWLAARAAQEGGKTPRNA